jgi:hypothetical protein
MDRRKNPLKNDGMVITVIINYIESVFPRMASKRKGPAGVNAHVMPVVMTPARKPRPASQQAALLLRRESWRPNPSFAIF